MKTTLKREEKYCTNKKRRPLKETDKEFLSIRVNMISSMEALEDKGEAIVPETKQKENRWQQEKKKWGSISDD